MAKTVIITGASAGIGAACARLFATKGYNLSLVARNEEKLASVKIKCQENGANSVLAISQDLSKTNELGSIVDKTVSQFGTIDVLINNAGTMKPGGLEDQTLADFDFVMAVNCKVYRIFGVTNNFLSGGRSSRSYGPPKNPTPARNLYLFRLLFF